MSNAIPAHRPLRRFLFPALMVVATILGATLGAYSDEAPLKLAGTLDIDQTRVSFVVSGNGGGGTLHYRGRDYPFSIGGLGIGGIGITKLEASGEVYNMTETSQFTGVYTALRTGYALGDTGSGKLWLKNGDGVVLRLKGKGKGIGLSLGADAVHVSFK